MKFIQNIRNRLFKIESKVNAGSITLSDGSKFKPSHSGLSLFRNYYKLADDLGRDPLLTDFSEDEQSQWCSYAKWSPDSNKHGAISVWLSEMGSKLVASKGNENEV